MYIELWYHLTLAKFNLQENGLIRLKQVSNGNKPGLMQKNNLDKKS